MISKLDPAFLGMTKFVRSEHRPYEVAHELAIKFEGVLSRKKYLLDSLKIRCGTQVGAKYNNLKTLGYFIKAM